MYQAILVRYGEISLKGSNRSYFVKSLIENINKALRGMGKYKIENSFGRLYLYIDDEPDLYLEKLKLIPGIVSLSPVAITGLDFDKIKALALEVFKYAVRNYPTSFKVQCSRPNKAFPLKSPEINMELGAYLLKEINTVYNDKLSVDVHSPEHLLNVEIRNDKALVYTETVYGVGGLPVGTSGKGLLLLSGGIDSPVAGWLAMKRGMTLDALYFHSFPYTSDRAKEKVLDLAKILSGYGGSINLFISHFTDIQMEIMKVCPPKYTVIIMRRMMMRIASRIARKNKTLALVTGENIGQVASQTLESIHVINEVTNLPVLRPLITMDKNEIIQIARQIGTYETSILPYEDCCTIFVPRHPVTRPTLEEACKAEEKLDVEKLITESMEKSETIVIE
ncbi:MAG: tRNA 4-thiouridine(8) synthase ThiI [Halanaerobiaceae bacterium]|jgi:thiamine biosynthesis protein ThiI|nr:tRNA 4-thiouridine(8) synthase ThiI [Halanaerobiaceae bacterium]